MTDHIDFDHVAQAWLREGPDQLADHILDAALEQVHDTAQLRRRGLRWRFPDMSSSLRIAGALTVVAIAAAGTFALLPRQPSVGTIASPIPAPTTSVAPASVAPTAAAPTASAAAPVALIPFQSTRYHYSMDRPASWTAVAGTEDWAPDRFPSPGGVAEDRFVSDKDPDTWILATSDPLRPGEQAGARRSKLDQENTTICALPGQPYGFHSLAPVEVDGVSARREAWECGQWMFTELFFANADRVYLIDLARTGQVPTDADQATLERMLTTFRFR